MAWNVDETPVTTINGERYELSSADEVVAKIKEIARSLGYSQFDVRDVDEDILVAPDEIKVGGNYEIVPYNAPK